MEIYLRNGIKNMKISHDVELHFNELLKFEILRLKKQNKSQVEIVSALK